MRPISSVNHSHPHSKKKKKKKKERKEKSNLLKRCIPQTTCSETCFETGVDPKDDSGSQSQYKIAKRRERERERERENFVCHNKRNMLNDWQA